MYRPQTSIRDRAGSILLVVLIHAALLYAADLPTLSGTLQEQVVEFIADQRMLVDVVRHAYVNDAHYGDLLTDERVDSNTGLLQFGDHTSLQVIMPWSPQRQLPNCPLNTQERITITMSYTDNAITFAPWPFGVDRFAVEIHGKVLSDHYFADEEAYHAALAEAPLLRLAWEVVKE